MKLGFESVNRYRNDVKHLCRGTSLYTEEYFIIVNATKEMTETSLILTDPSERGKKARMKKKSSPKLFFVPAKVQAKSSFKGQPKVQAKRASTMVFH